MGVRVWAKRYFNPRSPRGGATQDATQSKEDYGVFQSTLPTRGSDKRPRRAFTAHNYFNPRSPRGGATLSGRLDRPLIIFQSTLPTRGSDAVARHGKRLQILFQSTLPTRGSDPAVAPPPWVGLWDFNPRSPRGGATHRVRLGQHNPDYFNPRSPRGGATPKSWINLWGWVISIHAPHEGERRHNQSRWFGEHFISIHAPHEGERQPTQSYHVRQCPFQSTLPTRGSDEDKSSLVAAINISIHAPHEGERLSKSR